MENRYYTIVTDYGIEKIAESMNTGTKINITEFAIGDGGGGYYKPQKGAKALKNEVWRGMVNACHISEKSENIVEIESVIPSDEGGFTVREMGVYDDKGGLFAIGNTPDTQKAGLSEGIVYELSLSMEIALSNTDSLQLVVDPHVLTATKKEIQELQIQVDAKQEAEEGKGLSTNDFTDEEKQKLSDIESGANKTIVDSVLSSTSTNPIQNKAVDEVIENLSQAIAQANQLITNLQALRASPTTYGMVKVTDSAAVMDSTGLALAATEKNATIQGTLANKIAQLNTDLIFRLKDHQSLGENYVMNWADFTRPGLYHIGSLSEADEKNYPHPYNVGYYHLLCVSDNGEWQVLLLFSPRLWIDNKVCFYIGYFQNGNFSGWFLFSGTYN